MPPSAPNPGIRFLDFSALFLLHFYDFDSIGIVSESNQFQTEFRKSIPGQLNSILSYFNLIPMQFATCPTPIIEWQIPTQHCAVLCCAVLCCAELCCAILWSAVLLRVVLYCAVLCRAVLCCAVLCSVVLCYMSVLCCAMLHCAVLDYVVLCCAMLCRAVLYRATHQSLWSRSILL